MMGFGIDYLMDFSERYPNSDTLSFNERRSLLLYDRHGASHVLKPMYERGDNCFFTVCDDLILQKAWATENHFPSNNPLDIVLAQIEAHGTEVLYNNHPIAFPSSFVRRLPKSVKKAVAWRAAPVGATDLSAYDLILSNFETLNNNWRAKGWRAAYFTPSWDSEMRTSAENRNRNNDIFFAGSYSRTTGHDDRLQFLNSVAKISNNKRIDLHLLYRRFGRLADRFPLRFIPVPIYLPQPLKSVIRPPVYGRAMYSALSQAKIVINPATDFAGDERGNMRVWEALGCGACMIGSAGRYPDGLEPGVHFEMFTDTDHLLRKINILLEDKTRIDSIAAAGYELISSRWTKDAQWTDFINLVSHL